jgi:hypothetical protein
MNSKLPISFVMISNDMIFFASFECTKFISLLGDVIVIVIYVILYCLYLWMIILFTYIICILVNIY